LRDGNVYTENSTRCKETKLQGIIKGKIDAKSIVMTDGWRGYDGLVDVWYDKHFRVNHGKNEFALKGDIHINGIESFWSFTKRRLRKFNGVKNNFELHLNESEFRWRKTDKEIYDKLILIFKKRDRY
jgi:transposase-like protein